MRDKKYYKYHAIAANCPGVWFNSPFNRIPVKETAFMAKSGIAKNNQIGASGTHWRLLGCCKETRAGAARGLMGEIILKVTQGSIDESRLIFV
jgi:hypothetical protein